MHPTHMSPSIQTGFHHKEICNQGPCEEIKKVNLVFNAARVLLCGGSLIAFATDIIGPVGFVAGAVALIATECFRRISLMKLTQSSTTMENVQNSSFTVTLTVTLANVFKSISNPFEFKTTDRDESVQNDYDTVLKFLKSKVLACKEQNKKEKKNAIEEDKKSGPLLNDLLTDDFISIMKENKTYTDPVKKFIDKYKTCKVFHFLKNYLGKIRGLEMPIMAAEVYEALPIVNNTKVLSDENKDKLATILFDKETMDKVQIKPEEFEEWKRQITNKDPSECLEGSTSEELVELVGTKEGAFFLYFLNQVLDLHIVKQEDLMSKVNRVKEAHTEMLGNRDKKVKWIKNGFRCNQASVILTQEPPGIVQEIFNETSGHTVFAKKNVCIFLKNQDWRDQETLDLGEEEVNQLNDENLTKVVTDGKFLAVTAIHRKIGKRFLFMSTHADSKSCKKFLEAGLVVEFFKKLRERSANKEVGFMMGNKTRWFSSSYTICGFS